MTPRLWGWVAILVVASAYEVWGVLDPRQKDTLSELTRLVVGSGSVGRWIFVAAWGAFAAWFGVHIYERKRTKREP